MDSLLSFFANLRLRDVADILLNSYILFRLYALFRRTNAFRVLIGIVILLFFQRIAVYFGLVVTSWVMQGVMAAAALIVIVVFRNEIRTVLQVKNLKTFLWGFPNANIETPVETIAEAVFEMAQKRTGCLLVFSGKEDLEEIVHSGISWNGTITKEMILSVFWNGNPVHDGAAIVEGDQITWVGAVLPVSKKDLPSYYGTRHRAAIGLAETTDALVVVGSEERGEVSAAKGDRIKTVRDKEALLTLLREHLEIPERESGFLKRKKLELAIVGMISVLFVSGVWFSFTRVLDTVTNLEIPIEYMNRGQEMEIVETSVNLAHLTLSGSSTLAKSLRPEQIKVRIDLSQVVIGKNVFNITGKNISLPPGLVLRNVRPDVVEVVIDKLATKSFPIQVDWVGKLPDNLRLTHVTVVPEKIMVKGGSIALRETSTIYTEKVPLETITESGSKAVSVILSPASLESTPESGEKIMVYYEVKTRTQGMDR